MIRFLLLLLPVAAWAQVNSNNDFQIWQRDTLNEVINERLTSSTTFEGRWGDDVKKMFYFYVQTELDCILVKGLSVSLGYRQSFSKLLSSGWRPLYIPYMNLTGYGTASGWQISDRSRLQYEILEKIPNQWLYRNRFRVVSPSLFKNYEVSWFTDNEVFWRQTQGVDEDRYSIGFMYEIKKHLGGELYYLARFLRTTKTRWIHTNVLDIVFEFTF